MQVYFGGTLIQLYYLLWINYTTYFGLINNYTTSVLWRHSNKIILLTPKWWWQFSLWFGCALSSYTIYIHITYSKITEKVQVCFVGTEIQSLANVTMFSAFIKPNPKSLLTQIPLPFLYQVFLLLANGATSAVKAIRCITSRYVSPGLKVFRYVYWIYCHT